MPIAWLPIREASSPDIPFDFSILRILEVKRLKNGNLNAKAFLAELRQRLESLLSYEIIAKGK